ncbi:MAG: hypothetical protein M3336_11920, partial [Chloroflexota bacterium]|nr:hypothetical protein [Chloroflexota bacterium]
VYDSMYRWLKPGGFMSHTIDFRAHDTSSSWYGHWTYSDFGFRVVRGKRPYMLNREPHSTHVELLRKLGFEIVCDVPTKETAGAPRERLAPRFRGLSDEDLTTSGAFIQAVKR